jgi:hypothetical protein
MKYITLVLFMMLVTIIGCKPQPVVDMDAEIAAINTLIDEYVKSVETENMALYARRLWQANKRVGWSGQGYGRSERIAL